ncbi:MAG: DNA recombination protein RmuC [Porphyromonas sp.]|uniref:DNA recombination protein RmuC n=1 Tax=Porphyromonas sp. TaxID=1924944 RepID=UPI002A90B20C|nr:DNA recombination protein RmuC [Porphyromonas sp.]MDD7468805.1 DNA recombination protein RmuC [Bacteroidales bacterium]MDY6102249.1 DNA recombination protein RmuC [Porphyromonas sp.]
MTTLEIVLLVVVGCLLILVLLLVGRMGRLTATAARTEATLESEQRKREEQEGLFDRQLDRMTERFEALSEVITKRRADELTSANKQELDLVLAPLRASIDKMDLALKSTGETNARRSGELDRQIRMLIEQTTAVGDKADRLARAMSTSGKVQGDWGEKRLEQILQREGFIRGTEYDSQVVLRRGGQVLRPDFVLHFPDGRDVMVDAKVSLQAFLRYHDAGDEEGRQAALADMERDLRAHVSELAKARYHELSLEGRSTFPYTLMFVPMPSVLQLLSSSDLRDKALTSKVFIVTPESLMLFLRIISEAWISRRQEENIAEVIALADKMLRQVDNMMEDFRRVGGKLDDAKTAYAEALTHLSGRQGMTGYADQIRRRIR